jgi:hypothetical protein
VPAEPGDHAERQGHQQQLDPARQGVRTGSDEHHDRRRRREQNDQDDVLVEGAQRQHGPRSGRGWDAVVE